MIGAHDWRGPDTYQSDAARQQMSLRRLAAYPWAPAYSLPRDRGWRLVKGIWEPSK